MLEQYKVERWKEAYSPNAAMLRLTLVREGYEVFQWGDRPGMYYGPHKHPEDQSHWIISGTLEIHVKDHGSFRLEAGDRDFMPAETYHTAQVIGDEPVLYLIGVKPIAVDITQPGDSKKTKPANKKPTKKPKATSTPSKKKKLQPKRSRPK